MSGPTEVAPTPTRITLADGRTLSWYEFGDPAGSPCLFLPGTATSGLAGAALTCAATAAGIRLLSLDRPGLGRSDPAPERPLRDWADDVEQLVDSLGLQAIGVLGHSAGGAYALAVSRALSNRVTLTVVGAGSPPYAEGWLRTKGLVSRYSRLYFGLARRAPTLFGTLHMISTPRSPKAMSRMTTIIARGSSPDAEYARTHPAETRASLEALADGCRQGSRGPTTDVRSICKPWAFQLHEVRGPVQWWHGEQDSNISAALGREVVAQLPVVETHFVDGGHYALFAHAGDVMSSLKAAAQRP
jgi:pimeloyl-ACP methyl ester carboxylesterase